MSITPRLGRLFASDGKCFNVAIDHGFFNEFEFLKSIEDMASAVATVVDANPDVMQLTTGQARHLQNIPGKQKPTLALRIDTANVYAKKLPDSLFSQLIGNPVEQALRLDAGCVVVNLLLLPDEPEVHHQCVANVCQLKSECERFGMPMMVEPLVMRTNEEAGGYMVDGNIEKASALIRQSVELGADIIKADPSDDIGEYHRVIEIASPVPVLVRGGGRVSDEEILARTQALMEQGAAGIVYGRNVIQHPIPALMTAALMAVVHDGADATQAAAILKG